MTTKLNLAITPDILPSQQPSWYVFCNILQKKLNISIFPVEFYAFKDLTQAISRDEVDLILANPFTTTELVQNNNFIPIAKPTYTAEEMVIICKKDKYKNILELPKTLRISASENEDIRQLGLIMLEPASIDVTASEFITANNNLLSIKKLVNGETDIAFLPKATFASLSKVISDDLHLLVSNQKEDVDALSYVFLLNPKSASIIADLKQHLQTMSNNETEQQLLKEMHVNGWHIINDNSEIDFLINLVETLQI